MKSSVLKHAAAFALVAALGCSESAPVEDADLTNAEAAALVAAETEKTKADDSDAEAVVEAAPVAFNVEGAPTVDFSVPDMMCEDSCVPTVKATLAAQPGVK